MAEAEYNDEEIMWERVRDSFSQYQKEDTEYIADQLEFMDSVHLSYPDETEMKWEEDIPGQYEKLVDSFGEVDQYLDYLKDGSMVIYAEQENDPLFVAHGRELKQHKHNSAGLNGVASSLSG